MIRRLFRPLIFVALLVLAGCNSPEEEPTILPTAVPTYAVTDLASDSTAGEDSNSTLTAATESHDEPTPMATVAATSAETVAETSDQGDGESVQPNAIVATETAPTESETTEPETPEHEVVRPDEEISSDEQQDAAPDTPEDELSASTPDVNTVDANSAEEIDDAAAPDSESMADVESASEDAVEEEPDAAVVSDEEQSTEEIDNASIIDEADDLYAGVPASIAALIPEADVARGEQLSLQNGCIGCHNLDPEMVMAGPTWYGLGDTAAERVEDQSAAFYLYQSIINPNDYVVDGYMPNIMLQTYGDTLSEQDQADLIAYLLSLHEE